MSTLMLWILLRGPFENMKESSWAIFNMILPKTIRAPHMWSALIYVCVKITSP